MCRHGKAQYVRASCGIWGLTSCEIGKSLDFWNCSTFRRCSSWSWYVPGAVLDAGDGPVNIPLFSCSILMTATNKIRSMPISAGILNMPFLWCPFCSFSLRFYRAVTQSVSTLFCLWALHDRIFQCGVCCVWLCLVSIIFVRWLMWVAVVR